MRLPIELNLFGKPKLPVILAVEAAECGLAAMAMVAVFHGHDVDLNGLRQRFGLSMAGASLRNLVTLADALCLSSRAIRLDLDDLRSLPAPAILHWGLNHFVVLAKATRSGVIIHDPAVGRVKLSYAEASLHFSGVALELHQSNKFEAISDRHPTTLNSLWSKIHGFWGGLAQVVTLSIGLQICAFLLPFQMQLVVDNALSHSDANFLLILALGFGALTIVQAIIDAMRSYAVMALGHMLNFQMIGNLVRHLMRLKSDYFEKRHLGDVMSRIGSSIPVQEVLTQGLVSVIIDGFMAIIAIGILFYYSVQLTLVVVISLVGVFILTFSFYPVIRRKSEQQIVAKSVEQSHLMQTVRAIVPIRIMGREGEREGHWRNLFANTINTSFSLGKYRIAQSSLKSAILGIQTIIVIYIAGKMILNVEGFSVGMLVAFLSFRQTFTDRISALIDQLFQFRILSLHLDRLGDIVQAEPELDDSTSLADQEVLGNIELDNVSFRYGEGDPVVLERASLTIVPGEYVALVGPSGGGKTTLLKLMLGLHRPTGGQIRLDGCPASPAHWRNWRSAVGAVTQDDQLLSGTLAENISFFDPDLDMARVREAANAASIHDTIMGMPMQYRSLVGDMGSTLSGGQKQRVLLARALYRKPSILILDEGTANLDAETEQRIATMLKELTITRIVVAHRPALIEYADRIIEVRGGRLLDRSKLPTLQSGDSVVNQ
tara:strand:+ start:24528 stop:26675 length:2148 start_codon:yes stop_codon:yes gene_type:complete